jgi:hypothetical protein
VTALREHAEASAGGLLTVNKRVDALLLALEDAFHRIEVLTSTVELLTGTIAWLAEPDRVAALDRCLATLDGCERQDDIHAAAKRLRDHSPEALEQFLRKREEAKRAAPWIPPRGTGRRPGDRRIPANVVPVEVEVGPDGKQRVWGYDRPDDPLARY